MSPFPPPRGRTAPAQPTQTHLLLQHLLGELQRRQRRGRPLAPGPGRRGPPQPRRVEPDLLPREALVGLAERALAGQHRTPDGGGLLGPYPAHDRVEEGSEEPRRRGRVYPRRGRHVGEVVEGAGGHGGARPALPVGGLGGEGGRLGDRLEEAAVPREPAAEGLALHPEG